MLASCVLTLAVGLFAINILLVLVGEGIAFQWGWLIVRSTTIEFPIISLLCVFLLLLIVRGRQKEALLVCSALVVAALIGEVLLRIVDHPLSKPYVDYVAWYQPSDVFGHQLVPNFEGFGPLDLPVKINSHGFRDEEHAWEKERDTLRILGLGDSFTFGWGVSHKETFLKQLEPLVHHATGRQAETISAGVPGWGLNQYYLYLKTIGVKYSPDVVVLAYFTDDLPGSILEAIPANEQYRGGLQFKGGACHYSRLYNFSKSLGNQIRQKNRVTRIEFLHNQDARRAEWSKRPNYLTTEGIPETNGTYERLLSDYLSRIKQIADDHGAVLVVMYIPDISQIYHPEVQYINRALADLTRSHGIPFVDMTPLFERAPDIGTYYLWPRDPHTNAAGHRAMARALLELICLSDHSPVAICQ
ncbi:MAG: SGNH/GDSL hydrolase family protein [Nitrospiraceae bacterium]